MRPIDADNLISVLDILCDKGGDIAYWEQLKSIVASCPTIDAVPVKHGKWLKAYGAHEAFGIRPFYRYCSCCNEATVFPYNYCPNCGARMDGDRDEPARRL